MAYDLKIVGGQLVDGTGAPARRADVAVKDGRVVAVGDCPDEATTVIDAAGAIVTPGFVDIHCHYDGQVSWDGDLAPSSQHGVTTCVVGNCGVGFAPVRPSDRDALVALMEGVEDIPGSALAEGVKWEWESFPEYMDAIDRIPHTMDIGLQIPHDALRLWAMGPRAVANEQATDADIARMRDAVAAALDAGAVGFSTGRTDNHRGRDGSATPSSEATLRELAGIAEAFAGRRHGVLQAVSDFDMATGPARFDAEFDVLEGMAAAAKGRPLSVSLLQRDMEAEQWERILKRVEAATAKGQPTRVQVAPRAIGVILGLEATFHPFIGFPSYKAVAHLPLAERVAAMRAPGFRDRILAETTEPVAGDGSNIPPLVDILLANMGMVSMRMFRLGEQPEYEPKMDDSLGMEALARGVGALEVLFDAMLEHDGRQLLYFPLYNYTEFNLDVVGRMMAHPLALLGLSDGGAHVGTTCDASFPSFLLSYWVRDRATGRIPLERAVHMLSGANAAYLGLDDRGVVAVGRRADLNVIDLGKLRLGRPRVVYDLPAGGRRFLQDADGYRATVVAGQVVSRDGRLTGARPGRVLRLGR
jgi:N-acyl-D-aspartate/D-glutamate deacylase